MPHTPILSTRLNTNPDTQHEATITRPCCTMYVLYRSCLLRAHDKPASRSAHVHATEQNIHSSFYQKGCRALASQPNKCTPKKQQFRSTALI